MMSMNKLVIRSVLLPVLMSLGLMMTPTAWAAGGGDLMYFHKPDLDNKASLQRGFKYFVNYCSGCHSMNYVRYNRVAKDIGIPEELLQKNVMFGTDAVGETIELARSDEDAADWFGAAPPDLSLKARSRGPDWIYSFMKTYYVDDTKPNGVNNATLSGTSMPFVLGHLGGWQKAVYEEDSQGQKKITGFEMVKEGSMSADEYDQMLADLVNFMTYAAEPAKLVRYDLGRKVIYFLLVLVALTWLLKREYWKDVH